MKKIFITLALLLTPFMAHATDIKMTTTIPGFFYGIFDSVDQDGISGLTITTDYLLKMKCAGLTEFTVTGSPTDIGSGYYYIAPTNTVAMGTNYNYENECLVTVVGQNNLANLIAYSPVKFKAVSGTSMSTGIKPVTCSITAATSGTSFTVSSCTDDMNSNITLQTNTFVGSYMVAYSRTATQCNVVGEGVFVGELTNLGVVGVKTSDLPGSGFSATPNIANCGVRISP